MKNEAIRTENLSKSFGKVRAVKDLSISVGEGEIYGFLGLNGAGKTTTIRMLLGMIRPSAGAAFLEGKKTGPDETGLWKDVGYLVEAPSAYPDLTVRENLEITRRLRGMNGSGEVDAVIERLGLGPYRDRKAKHLSTGNAQRMGLAKALIHDPRILILDEPTNGLDPSGIVEIRELLLDLSRSRGVTVFVSSHILSEISKTAVRIGIIHNGKLVQEIDVADLERYRRRRLLVKTLDAEGARTALAGGGYAPGVSGNGDIALEDARAVDHPETVSNLLARAGYPPTMLRVEEEDLESYFLRVIGSEGDGK